MTQRERIKNMQGFKSKTVRKEPELLIQSNIIQMLKENLKHNVLMTASPAGGGGRVRGAKLKRAGLQSGWPDIQLIHEGRYYGLEVKTSTGRLSPAQKIIHQKLTDSGCLVAVVKSVTDAQEKIVEWGISRRYKKNVESDNITGVT